MLKFVLKKPLKNLLPTKIKELFLLKFKFALTSLVATALDYTLYIILVYQSFTPVLANTIAYTIAVILNFSLQKKFVFSMKRKERTVFMMAIGVSVVGLGLSNLIIWSLTQYPFFIEHPYVTKLIATGLVFFWNFYMKRFVFERKFI
ncbi:MAG: putative flippase GtrA [Paraglaciecola sp.]|jgi:putative flippase GtrA